MTRKDVAFNVEFTEQTNEYGEVEKWPVLTWSWDGGSITIKDWEPVELNGAGYLPETAWNPLTGGYSESDEGFIVNMAPNCVWDFRDVPTGTVTGAVIQSDGTIYLTRATDDVTMIVRLDGANHHIECNYREADDVLVNLYARGGDIAFGTVETSIHRGERIDHSKFFHVSQLVPDVDLDPDVWGGLLN